MIRNVAVLALALAIFAVVPAAAQAGGPTFTWNGPLTGTTNWTAGAWSPSTPTAGGQPGTTIIFNQIGVGAYNAANNLGNPYRLDTLDFQSGGGGITLSSIAGNTLEIGNTSFISQNGIGVAVISSSATLSGNNFAMFGGSNFGHVSVSGSLSGTNSVRINRAQNQFYTGLVDLTVANTYGGGTDLQAGNLRVGNATALGSGPLRVTGGTLGATAPVAISNLVMLTGADLVYSGFADLTLIGVISQTGVHGLTLSTMNFSTLTLQGNNTYTGPTNAVVNPRSSSNFPAAGSLTFSGPNGAANSSSQFDFKGGGTLTLDNRAANIGTRIGDTAPVSISGGAFAYIGGFGLNLENVGAFTGSGAVTVTVDANFGSNTGTTLQPDSLNRSNRAQFLFRGDNNSFGNPVGNNVPRLVFDSAPTLSGGGGTAGSTNISIIPYAIGGTSTSSFGTELVTYGANGIRPLRSTANEYVTTIANGTSTLNNAKITTTQVITAPTQINALVVNAGGDFTGSTSTLTLANGTLLNTGALTIPTAMTLAFGASEGFIFNNNSMTVDGILTGTNGLTVRGGVTLNNVNNNVTGTLTINEGSIEFSNPAVIGSFANIVVNGRSDTSLPPGLNFVGASGTIAMAMDVTDGFASLRNQAGGMLTYSGQITGAGGILVRAGDVELTNTGNGYTGQTRVFSGNLLVSGDNVLGNGGGVDIAGLSTFFGLRLTGNWTTSRQINFSDDSLVDTNGFNWIVNSPLTGTASTIDKVGAGVWTLSQGGALGQSLQTGQTATTTTLNIQAGELRATNTTGSATGTASVNINGTSILSGNGNFGGATTIASTAFVQPGQGGTTIATLRFGGTLVLDGTLTVDVVAMNADRVNVAGALTLGAGSVLNFPGTNTYDDSTTYTLMQFSSLFGTFATTPGIPGTHMLVYNPTTIQLVPVPEPTAILAVAGLAFGIGYRIRRRR